MVRMIFYITLGTVEQGELYRSSPPVSKMGKGHTTKAGVPFRIPIMDNRTQAFSYNANPALTTSLCERDIRQAEAGPYPFPLVTLFACWQETAYHTRSSLVKAMPCGGLAFLPFPINSTKPDSFCCVRFVHRFEFSHCVAKTNPCAIPSATFGSYGIVLSRNKITVVAFVYLVFCHTFMDLFGS